MIFTLLWWSGTEPTRSLRHTFGSFFLVRLYELVDFPSCISGIHLTFVHRRIVHIVSGVTLHRYLIVIKSPWKMPMIYRLHEFQEKVKLNTLILN